MKSKFYINKPDDMDATMEITMSVKLWKELRDQLPNSHPSWKLSDQIRALVDAADRHFYKNQPGFTDAEEL